MILFLSIRKHGIVTDIHANFTYIVTGNFDTPAFCTGVVYSGMCELWYTKGSKTLISMVKSDFWSIFKGRHFDLYNKTSYELLFLMTINS